MPETFEYWNDLALSDNYKDRFRSEYNILLIRTRKLSNMLKKWKMVNLISPLIALTSY